jgi:hypothetical protein
MRLVFSTIFTLLTVLAGSPERDHGGGTGWMFGKDEDEGKVVIAERGRFEDCSKVQQNSFAKFDVIRY